MSNVPLDRVDVFNYLGLDPHAPTFPPTISEMRPLLRSLKLLLHPDKIATNPNAEYAQRQLELDYVTLEAIISGLGLDRSTFRLRSLPKTKWVSTWNPHGFDNGPLSEPLPSWSRRRSSCAVQVSTFPSPGIQGAPRFDGANLTPAIVAKEATDALMRMGNDISGPGAACIAVARLRYNGFRSCVAVANLDPDDTSCHLQCRIWQDQKHVGTVQFNSLAIAAGLGYGSMFAAMSQVRLLGVFSRVPRLVLELYLKKFLVCWQDQQAF